MTTTAAAPTITLNGESGSSYQFYLYPWGEPFKAVPGVYSVLRRQQDTGKYTVLYVGETDDLSQRFKNHHKQGCFDSNRRTHIAARVEGDRDRRLAIEKDLRTSYTPPCNDQ